MARLPCLDATSLPLQRAWPCVSAGLQINPESNHDYCCAQTFADGEYQRWRSGFYQATGLLPRPEKWSVTKGQPRGGQTPFELRPSQRGFGSSAHWIQAGKMKHVIVVIFSVQSGPLRAGCLLVIISGFLMMMVQHDSHVLKSRHQLRLMPGMKKSRQHRCRLGYARLRCCTGQRHNRNDPATMVGDGQTGTHRARWLSISKRVPSFRQACHSASLALSILGDAGRTAREGA